MRNPNIGLVGAGALGSRHLQSLALTNRVLNIFILDNSEHSLIKSKELFYLVDGSTRHTVIFTTDIKDLPEELDVVIVATGSNVRRVVIEQIVNQCKVSNFILEKILFQKLEDYEVINNLFKLHNIKAWVNCPRRMYTFYKQLKSKLTKATSMEFSVSGSSWGLGCNTIHFMDIIAFLAGYENIQVDLSEIGENYINSKREGYLEITGTISGKMGKCKNFCITSYNQNECPISLQISSDILKCTICEINKTANISESINGWVWQEEKFEVPYQSQLTHIILEEILDTNSCELTDYNTSMNLHISFQKPLIQYFTNLGVEERLCPIT